MNTRTVSLPDLVSEKRRNTTLSLSEGFAGANHEGALAATAQSFAPRTGLTAQGGGDKVSANLGRVLPIYYRTRQLVLSTEKAGHRVPMKLQTELRSLEKSLASEIRSLHPLLFQRFDDLQLDRLLRSMSFMRLSQGRWIFGGATLNAQWPTPDGDRSFILLSGRVSLFPDSSGAGEKIEVHRGQVFGDAPFKIGDESLRDIVCGAGQCEEPCIVGILTTGALEAAFADRAFGNRRIQQLVRQVPALTRVVHGDPVFAKQAEDDQTRKSSKAVQEDLQGSNAVQHALRDFSKVATTIHVIPGQEVLSEEPLEESVLMVSKGALEIRGDVTLVEKLDALPPKKARIRVYLDRAEGLLGDSIFDKLDAYCIVKLGDFKRFQSQVQWDAGPNPKFEYDGMLKYGDEDTLEFTVMDYDRFSADDLCGTGSLPISELYNGWTGKVPLTRPKRGVFKSDEMLEEPAGKLFITVRWDFEKVSALTRTPKEKVWLNQELFQMKKSDCWGHEQLVLGAVFKRTLEQATSKLPYVLKLDNFRVIGVSPSGNNDKITCWKASRRRFLDFVKHCGRERQFTQACRVSALEKQIHIQELITRLVQAWEMEEQNQRMRSGMLENKVVEEALDPSRFRVAYRGVKAHITVRNAMNLSGGGWFDKLDPYVIIRFRGSKAEMRTSVLQDAGSDPVWNCEGALVYNGEPALELSVWDYDKYSADDLLATGVLQVDLFTGGYEGAMPLIPAGGKKKKSLKQSMIVIGIQMDPPRDLGSSFATTTGLQGLRAIAQGA